MDTEQLIEDLQINFDPEEILDNTSEPPSPDIIDDPETEIEETKEENSNSKLYERIDTLRTTIQVLKEQLQEERENFQRELQESQEDDFINRTAKLGMDYYNDYDRYHDLILQAHYESRQNIQKQIAAANYKRRLMEVENMCTLELMKVRQSVQILQPLQVMVNEWKFESEVGDHNKPGDKSNALQPLQLLYNDWKGDKSNALQPLQMLYNDWKSESEVGDYCSKRKLDVEVKNEVEMPLESLSRLDDFKEKDEIQCGGSVSDPALTESDYCLLKQSQSDPLLVSENCVNS